MCGRQGKARGTNIANPPPPPSAAPLRPLRQHLPQLRIVFILVHMMHSDVPASLSAPSLIPPSSQVSAKDNVPLQIIRPRILVLSVRTKRTHIPGTRMHKAMPYHFVFALEALAALGAGAAGDGAVVRARLGVDVCVRTVSPPSANIITLLPRVRGQDKGQAAKGWERKEANVL